MRPTIFAIVASDSHTVVDSHDHYRVALALADHYTRTTRILHTVAELHPERN